jgi:hypothetical protein
MVRVYTRFPVAETAVNARTSLSEMEEDTVAEVKGEVSAIDREAVEYDAIEPVSME